MSQGDLDVKDLPWNFLKRTIECAWLDDGRLAADTVKKQVHKSHSLRKACKDVSRIPRFHCSWLPVTMGGRLAGVHSSYSSNAPPFSQALEVR